MKRIILPIICLRWHILAFYIAAIIIILSAPLPSGIPGLLSLAGHFTLFFGLQCAVELAHLFKGKRSLIAYTIMLAIFFEALQAVLPYRQFDLVDIMANASGVIIAHSIISYNRTHPILKFIQSHAEN